VEVNPLKKRNLSRFVRFWRRRYAICSSFTGGQTWYFTPQDAADNYTANCQLTQVKQQFAATFPKSGRFAPL